MPASTCDARVARVGDVAVVRLGGDIDARAREVFASLPDRIEGAMVLDFRAVGYINSSGIALIVGLLATARRNGTAVAAFGLSDHYREIFAITRLTDYVRVADDEAAAVADVA